MTKAFCFDILCKLAHGKPSTASEANLENDTEKKRANIKEKTSEDSKEFSTLMSVRIKRKSLILAQDERWRRA